MARVILPDERTLDVNVPNQLIEYEFEFNLIGVPDITFNAYGLRLDLKPGIPKFAKHVKSYELDLIVKPIEIELERAFRQLTRELLKGKIASYFDDDRELRTLLNFGQDRQILLTNWMLDPTSTDQNAILVKLYEPLPSGINVKDQLWISREITPPLLEQFHVLVREAPIDLIYLRPRNENLNLILGQEVNETTLDDIFPSGAVNIPANWPTNSVVTLQESSLERMYSIDYGSAELNIDYSAWSNFVHFSSAKKRLEIFREKLVQIEELQNIIDDQLSYASTSYVESSKAGETPVPLISTSIFPALRQHLEDKQDIIKSFDGYEKFLYYETGSLSASLSGDDDEDLILYLPTASWPKNTDFNLHSVTSSISVEWYGTHSDYADDYDGQNPNWLYRTIPQYIQEDLDSEEFGTFVNMVGHHFDLIKNYIDQMTQIYDRDPDAERGLSKDLIWHIGESLGLEFPHLSLLLSSGSLPEWITTATSSSYIDTYQDATVQAWKRFLHSHIYLMKTKGTDESFRALFNIYGIPYETLRLKTTMRPSIKYTLNPSDADLAAFETFDEANYVLPFSSGTHLELAFSSSLIEPETVELRFATTYYDSGTLLIAGDGNAPSWSVEILPEIVTSSFTSRENVQKGKIVVKDINSQWVASSSADALYNGDYFTLMLRRNGSAYAFSIGQYKSEDFRYFHGPVSITTGSYTSSWLAPTLYVGGSGSAWFSGTIDEVRVWSEPILDTTFQNHLKFPGLYAGETTSSAREHLVWRLSFNKPHNLSTTASYSNESPFVSDYSGTAPVAVPISESIANNFSGSLTFPHSFSKIRRETQRFSPNAGGTIYSTNRVIIAPTGAIGLFPSRMIKSTGSTNEEWPILSREQTVRDYSAEAKSDNKLVLAASLAETLNDSILRSVGQSFDLHQLIGDPLNIWLKKYSDLELLNTYYAEKYRPASMSYQTLTRNVDGILDGIFNAASIVRPASARLLSGIVIEPTILERTKERFLREIVADGPTRRNILFDNTLLSESGSLPSAWNLDAHVVNSIFCEKEDSASIYSMSADFPYYSSSIIGEVTQSSSADYFTYESANPLFMTASDSMSADYVVYQDANPLFMTASNSMSALFPYYSSSVDYPTASVDSDWITYSASLFLSGAYVTKTGSLVGGAAHSLDGGEFITQLVEPMDLYPWSYWFEHEIAPRPSRFTYFTHISGSYGVSRTVRKRVFDDILVDRGTWTKGTVYRKYDVVTQENQTGDAAWGNGVQFRCLTSHVLVASESVDRQRRVNFESNRPPAVDTDNWSRVRYKLEGVLWPWIVVNSGSAWHGNDYYRATLVSYADWSASEATWSEWSATLGQVGLHRTTEGVIVLDDFNRTAGSLNATSPNFVTTSTEGDYTWSVSADGNDSINVSGNVIVSDSGSFNHKASLSASVSAFTGAFVSGVLVGMNVSARDYQTGSWSLMGIHRTNEGLIIYDDFNRDSGDLNNNSPLVTASVAGDLTWSVNADGTDSINISSSLIVSDSGSFNHKATVSSSATAFTGAFASGVLVGMNVSARDFSAGGDASMSRTIEGLIIFDDFNRSDVWTADQPWLIGNKPDGDVTFSIVSNQYLRTNAVGGNDEAILWRPISTKAEYLVQANMVYNNPNLFGKVSMSISASGQECDIDNLVGDTTWNGYLIQHNNPSNNYRIYRRELGTFTNIRSVAEDPDNTWNTSRLVFREAGDATTNISMSAHVATNVGSFGILTGSLDAHAYVTATLPANGTASTFIPGYTGTAKEAVGMSIVCGDFGAEKLAMFICCGVDITITGLAANYTASLISGAVELTSSTAHGDTLVMPIDEIALPATKLKIYDDSGAAYTESLHVAGIWGGDEFEVNAGSPTTSSFLPGIGLGLEVGESNMDDASSQWYFTSHSTSNNLSLHLRNDAVAETLVTSAGTYAPLTWHAIRMAYQTSGSTASTASLLSLYAHSLVSSSEPSQSAAPQTMSLLGFKVLESESIAESNLANVGVNMPGMAQLGDQFYACGRYVFVGGLLDNYTASIGYNELVLTSSSYATDGTASLNVDYMPLPFHTLSIYDDAGLIKAEFYPSWSVATGVTGGFGGDYYLVTFDDHSETASFLPGVGLGLDIGETNMDTAGSQWYFTSHSTSEELSLHLRSGSVIETLASGGTYAPLTWNSVRMAYQLSGSEGSASLLSLYAQTLVSSSEPSQSIPPSVMTLIGTKGLDSGTIPTDNLANVGVNMPGMAQLGDQFYACGRYIFVGGLHSGYTASISYNQISDTSSSYATDGSASINVDYMPLPFHTLSIYDGAGALKASFYPSWSVATQTTGGFGGDYYLYDSGSNPAAEPTTYSLAHEYTEEHYKFFRDTTTGYNRARYDGCLQTSNTTVDGKSPVETKLSSEAQLTVQDGTPIRRDKDEEGPILDVE